MSSSPQLKSYLKDKKLNPIERNKAAKDGLEIGKEINNFAKVGWEEMNKTDLELRLKWYGIFWRPKTPGKFMLRLRIPNGILNTQQLQVISSIVARYGTDGSCDITTRQNLQLRGILISDLPEILLRLDECRIRTIQSGFDNPRNVTGNPIAGIDPNEIIDTRHYTNQLEDYLTNEGKGNSEFSNLPRKWNTAVAGSRDNFLLHNDLIFHPVINNGQLGFSIWLGGILSSQLNDYAIPLNAWVKEEDICKITGIILTLWRDNGERNKRNKGRFRFYLDSIGVENFRNLIEEQYGTLQIDPGSVFNEKPRSLLGIHRQKQDKKIYVGLNVPVGRLKAEDLQDFARISKVYGSGEVRLTEDQNIIIPGIDDNKITSLKKENLLKKFLLEPGMIQAGTVSCTGNSYCSFALTNTKDQALQLAEQLDKELLIKEELKIHWTGCPNSCGQAYMGAIGLTGKKAKDSEGKIVEAYDISIGGSQSSEQKIGSLKYRSVPRNEIIEVVKNILIEDYSASPKFIHKKKHSNPFSMFLKWISETNENNE